MSSSKAGAAGEKYAAKYLKKQGYEIRRVNYRIRTGEIDIIAAKGDVLVFCEVKLRSRTDFGTPAEAVTPRKIGKILSAAKYYMYENGSEEMARFDIVEVYKSGISYKINHIEDAFTERL